MTKTKPFLLLTVKLLVLAGGIAIILHKADVAKIGFHLHHINLFFLIGALLIYGLAQILSAFRGRYYFSQNGLDLSPKFALVLYFLGMLYNTILPGGISGDGYKIYAVGKHQSFSKLTALRVLLSDRASGLFALLTLSSIAAYFSHVTEYAYSYWMLLSVFILTIIGYIVGIRFILKESIKTALGACKFSFPVQLLNMLVVVFLLLGLDPSHAPLAIDYIIIFMTASVFAILPISIGGAGIREVTFLYAASLLPINAELGVALALLFFIVNISCASIGLLFMHKLKHYS